MMQHTVVATALILAAICVGAAVRGWGASTAPGNGVKAKLSGGYETDPRDRGRPVRLVAAGLGVAEQVFREAFSQVRPAPAGQEPDAGQVRRNKEALLGALGKYGVTNERLDEVSNWYRYRPGEGRLWKHEEAVVRAVVEKGEVTGFIIEKQGAGYLTPPEVTVPGYPKVKAKVTLRFGKELEKNGSIDKVEVMGAETRQRGEGN